MRPIVLLSLLSLLVSLAAQAQSRGISLSGKVALPDGSPPPEPATLYLYCGGGRQPQAQTNKDGAFNFRIGGSQSVQVRDASRTGLSNPVGELGPGASGRGDVSLTGCELQAVLPGFTSSKVNLGRRSVAESPDVGVLILTPVGEDPSHLISANTREAPKKAKKSLEKAKNELAKEGPNLEKAIKELEKAVKEYPEFAEAWNLLGEPRMHASDLDGARSALEKAIDAEPKFAPPYVTLALMELQQRQPANAAKFADRAVELSPNLAEANYYRAVAHSDLGNLDAAAESIRTVQGGPHAARYPRTHFLLGNILLQQGDVPAAAGEFQQYVTLEPNSRAATAVRQQLEQRKAQGATK